VRLGSVHQNQGGSTELFFKIVFANIKKSSIDLFKVIEKQYQHNDATAVD
jgi:hypothetical protein